MNKVLKILALLGLLVLLFSGCQNSENELKNRLIVQAIGIDAQKDGTVLVTLQTLNTEMAGNPNSGASLGDVVTSFQVTGKTVADAISNAATMIGKKPLLSQNRLVVFGRDTAEQGILEHLDFFVRDTENRTTVLLAVSDTTAYDVVSAKMGENVLTADSIEAILHAQQFSTDVVGQALYSVINKMESDTADAYLPVLKASEEKEDESKVELCSVAVFQKDKLQYELNEEGITALQLLTNEVEIGYFSVENLEYDSTTVLKIRKSRVKIQPAVKNGNIHFGIQLQMTVDIAENQTENPFGVSKEFIQSTTKCAKEYITNLLDESLKQSFVVNQADPYRFGTRFLKAYTSYYKENIEDWKAVLPSVEYNIDTQIEVKYVGNGAENI